MRLAASLSLFLGACGGESQFATDCPGEPGLSVLAGPREPSEPLEDGGRVYLRCGNQGLRHVELVLLVNGLTPPVSLHACELTDRETPEVLGRAFYPRPIRLLEGDGSCESPDMLVIVDPPTDTLIDREARLVLEMSGNEDGQSAQTQLDVVIDTSQMECVL